MDEAIQKSVEEPLETYVLDVEPVSDCIEGAGIANFTAFLSSLGHSIVHARSDKRTIVFLSKETTPEEANLVKEKAACIFDRAELEEYHSHRGQKVVCYWKPGLLM